MGLPCHRYEKTYPAKYNMDLPCQVRHGRTLPGRWTYPTVPGTWTCLPGIWTYPTRYMDLPYQLHGPTLPGTWTYPARYMGLPYQVQYMGIPCQAQHGPTLPQYMGLLYQVHGHYLPGTWAHPARYNMDLPYQVYGPTLLGKWALLTRYMSIHCQVLYMGLSSYARYMGLSCQIHGPTLRGTWTSSDTRSPNYSAKDPVGISIAPTPGTRRLASRIYPPRYMLSCRVQQPWFANFLYGK